MKLPRKRKILLNLLVGFAAFIALAVGISLGLALAASQNIRDLDEYGDTSLALPTRVLDREGRFITEYYGDEHRELISIDDVPRHLIYALIVREDREFFEHPGFSFRGTFRAAWNILRGSYVSGGSTITQQLAGHMFDDRGDISYARKLRELWWAFQLERSWTKHEILEEYLNKMYFGHGTWGVQAASNYYFNRSAEELTPAESVMLVIQLANPSRYSPFRSPQRARNMQRVILNEMVSAGYLSQEEADYSFEEYWMHYDFTRGSASTAFLDREDEAPYFSEYVRGQLEGDILLGRPVNINRAGYTVHTTLDLEYQRIGERYLREGLDRANRRVEEQRRIARELAEEELLPIVDLLALTFDLPDLRLAEAKTSARAKDYYHDELGPILSAANLIFGSTQDQSLQQALQRSHLTRREERSAGRVEAALVTMEQESGHIITMIGGSEFETINQLNRAVDGRLEPGSAFKPLYYAAAIEKREVTPATILYDAPVVFRNDDGSTYRPRNYGGNWWGPVTVREALARSFNIPSISVFNRVGFTNALNTSARLLGIGEDQMPSRNLERRYPVALGIAVVSPLEMTRAFATLANQGRRVDPLAVRYVEDRDGSIVAEPERELRLEQRDRGREQQIVSPQTAYIMTDLMRSTFDHREESGTLRSREPIMDMAAKTGTTQNWQDGWVIGYSPYYTTTMWFGFDRGRHTLGTEQYGAALAGPLWTDFMNEIHEDYEPIDIPRPEDGIRELKISPETGLLVTSDYTGPSREELFLSGTEPTDYHPVGPEYQRQVERDIDRLRRTATSRGLRPGEEFAERIALPTVDEAMSASPRADVDLEEEFGFSPAGSFEEDWTQDPAVHPDDRDDAWGEEWDAALEGWDREDELLQEGADAEELDLDSVETAEPDDRDAPVSTDPITPGRELGTDPDDPDLEDEPTMDWDDIDDLDGTDEDWDDPLDEEDIDSFYDDWTFDEDEDEDEEDVNPFLD